MKKTLLFLAAFVPASLFAAAPPVREGSVSAPGTATLITVSSTAWTLAEPVAQLAGRTGMVVNNDSVNGSFMAGVLSTSSVSAVAATTIKVMEFAPGAPAFVPVSNATFLWLIYEGTSSANASGYIQEVTQ